MIDVVAGSPFEIRTARQLKHLVPVPHQTAIDALSHIANAGILRRILLADRLGGIAGGVVGNNQLEVAEALREQGVDRLREPACSVIDRQPDTYLGRIMALRIRHRESSRWQGPAW